MLDFEMGGEATALRARLRDLVDEFLPSTFLGAFTHDPADLAIAQDFSKSLAEQKLMALSWPSQYGGGDGSVWEQTVFREEMWAFHEPRGAQYMGINWVGPAIMRHGTDEQKATHLPPIAHGDVIWCQGFSEPDAGSDLASLRTAAVRDGDGWRISGQKIWTSYASMAQWCFLLARTSRGEKKQHGISIFLIPMDSPGIEVRPIASMLGAHHLNEVFLDGVFALDSAVLGPTNEGWRVVQEALALERVGIARYARSERLLQAARTQLSDEWDDLPEALRARWARALVNARRARLLAYSVIQLQELGAVRPTDSAAYRVAVTQLDQEAGEVLMDLIGSASVGTSDRSELFHRAVDDHWRYAQAATVASGSIEMQRILLARSLVGSK